MPSLSSSTSTTTTRSSPLQDPLLLQPPPIAATADNKNRKMTHAELALAAQASAAAADSFIKERSITHADASAAAAIAGDWHVMEQEEGDHHYHHHHESIDPNNNNRNETTSNNNTSSSSSASSSWMIWLGTTANLCSATLGCGVLALPAACAQTGIVVATCLTLVAALATIYSIHLLIHACSTYSLYSYESLTLHLLGRQWRRAVEFFMLLFCQGTAVAYLIAVCDILQQSHLLLFDSRLYTLLVVWILVELPLSLNRRMTHLQMASALGIAAIFTLIIAALVHLLDDEAIERKEQQHHHDDDNKNNWTMHEMLWPNQGNIISAITACPIILFAFSCQVNVCAIFQELPSVAGLDNDAIRTHQHQQQQQPVVQRRQQELNDDDDDENKQKQRLMSGVTFSAIFLCTLLYASISAIVLLDFGPVTTAKAPNLLQLYHLHNSNHSSTDDDDDGGNDKTNSTSLMQVAAMAMAVAVVVAFPLNIFPARVTLAGIFCSSSSNSNTMNPSCLPITRREEQRHSARRHSLNCNENLTAALLEDYPRQQEEEEEKLSIQQQQGLHDSKSPREHGNTTTITTTTGTTTRRKQIRVDQEAAAAAAAVAASRPAEPLPPLSIIHQAAQSSANDGSEKDCTNDELSCFNHVVLTLLLAGSALGMALIVPDISIVFSILGGTASSFLGFIIPGLLGLKLHRHDGDLRQQQQQQQQLSQPQRRMMDDDGCLPVVLSWLLILFGIVMGILTTGATIYSLIHA